MRPRLGNVIAWLLFLAACALLVIAVAYKVTHAHHGGVQ